MQKQQIKPYSVSGSKKKQVSTMFDNIAPWYDFLNHFLSVGIDTIWRKKAIKELSGIQPEILLDVATGTADLALEANKQLNPKKIVGLDISNEMLEIGRKKIKNKKLSDKIELLLGDSENLPFQENTFDAITVAFGVRNFENLDAGLKEMQRVLKPGGMVVVLEFSRPTLFPFKQLFNFYFRNILPFIGRITSRDSKAYSYLYESVQAFPDGKDFASALEKAGFQKPKFKSLTLGVCAIYTASK